MKPANATTGFCYSGVRVNGDCIVSVDDLPFDHTPTLAFLNKSPTGFNWGYGGSGPAQLAFGLLWHALLGNAGQALELHQRFKWGVVSKWETTWAITQRDIMHWVADQVMRSANEGLPESWGDHS